MAVDHESCMDANPGSSESARQARGLVGALVAAGLKDFVVSPGSRSTPLVLALQHYSGVRVRVILDERSAAFFALGIADRTHDPVALVCTSGTAGANYFPAVIEASERGVPLLLLTADRPPELRDCGAGQTIDQVGLFGKYVRWSVDAAAPSGEAGTRYFKSIARDGLRAATGSATGPVHFNLPFREPFLPEEASGPCAAGVEVGRDPAHRIRFDWGPLCQVRSGLILAGAANPENPQRWVDGLFRLSDSLGWPILADVLNPLRHSPGGEERVVTQYEGLFAAGIVGRDPGLVPEAILQVGSLPTAKSLRQWLAGFDGPRWQWSKQLRGQDPSRKPFAWIEGSPAEADDFPEPVADESYRGRWLELERRSVAAVSAWIERTPENFEGKIYHLLSQVAPQRAQVFFANSMPVRDAGRFWFADRPRGPRIFCNRGASGIDGLVSTVAGLADGGPPTFAVLGDLSFLHDCGGLRAAQGIRGSLTIIVVDNGGGRIFAQLPIRARDDVFEDYFLTPQAVDLQLLCKAHAINVHCLAESESLKELLSEPQDGVQVIIIRTDPGSDDLLRSQWRSLFEGIS